MRRVLLPLALLLVALGPFALPATAAVATETSSRLAPRVLGASDVPRLWLAQRAIDREWGLSEDSTYRTVDAAGWKSDGLALAFSGALPGAGQLYVGEGSGWLYLAAEALGWAGRVITHRKGDDLRDEAAAFAGDPTNPASTWSFARYQAATGGQAARLQELWAHDRDSFYQALASDPSYRAGFSGADPTVTFESYVSIHDASQHQYHESHLIEVTLWANHALSAFDALRAARSHNLPLRRTIDLQLGGRMRRGEPEFHAALVRRF